MIYNLAGQAVLSKTVSPANFAGPPIIAFGDGLTSTDQRWLAMLEFIRVIGTPFVKTLPLIGIGSSEPTTTLDAGLRALSVLFDVAQATPWRWSDGGSVRTPMLCGPIFALPTQAFGAEDLRYRAWHLSARYMRIAANNMFGIGNMAIGAGDPEHGLTPPVYSITGDLAGGLKTLANVWQGRGEVAVSSYARLAEIEVIRPGVSRKIHPGLVPFILLVEP